MKVAQAVYPAAVPRLTMLAPTCLAAVMLGTAAFAAGGPAAKTPIKHVVVIFQENHSFDVYFGAYPFALNAPGEPSFRARPGTPSVNGLNPTLIERNPNASKPFRIDRTQ